MDSLLILSIAMGFLLIIVLSVVAIWLRIQLTLMYHRQQAVNDFLLTIGSVFRHSEAMSVRPSEKRVSELPAIILLSVALVILARLLMR